MRANQVNCVRAHFICGPQPFLREQSNRDKTLFIFIMILWPKSRIEHFTCQGKTEKMSTLTRAKLAPPKLQVLWGVPSIQWLVVPTKTSQRKNKRLISDSPRLTDTWWGTQANLSCLVKLLRNGAMEQRKKQPGYDSCFLLHHVEGQVCLNWIHGEERTPGFSTLGRRPMKIHEGPTMQLTRLNGSSASVLMPDTTGLALKGQNCDPVIVRARGTNYY